MWEGEGGGLINFPPLKRGGLFERGGLIEDLRYIHGHFKLRNMKLHVLPHTLSLGHLWCILGIGEIEASPPPRAYPGHLTSLPSRGGGNLIIRVFQGVRNLIPMR